MEDITLQWFFKLPGLFITGGVLLILIAILVFIISNSKAKAKKKIEEPSSSDNKEELQKEVQVPPTTDVIAKVDDTPKEPVNSINEQVVTPVVDIPKQEETSNIDESVTIPPIVSITPIEVSNTVDTNIEATSAPVTGTPTISIDTNTDQSQEIVPIAVDKEEIKEEKSTVDPIFSEQVIVPLEVPSNENSESINEEVVHVEPQLIKESNDSSVPPENKQSGVEEII